MRTDKIYIFALIGGFVLFFIAVSAFMYSMQNDPIVGTWIGLHSSPKSDMDYRWIFTNNQKLKRYEDNKLYKEWTYQVSKTPNHCGVDMSDRLKHFPKNRILIMKNTKTQKKTCALVLKLSDSRLVWSFYQSPAYIDTLKKVQQ